jgi:hypothetical protein
MISTGPKSQPGKTVSNRNAETHGMLSKAPVLDIEDPTDWDAYRQGVLASLAPEGPLETTIAHRIASLAYSSRRPLRDRDDQHRHGLQGDFREHLGSIPASMTLGEFLVFRKADPFRPDPDEDG